MLLQKKYIHSVLASQYRSHCWHACCCLSCKVGLKKSILLTRSLKFLLNFLNSVYMPIDMALLVTGKFKPQCDYTCWFLLLLFTIPKLSSLNTLNINLDPSLVLKIPYLQCSLSVFSWKISTFFIPTKRKFIDYSRRILNFYLSKITFPLFIHEEAESKLFLLYSDDHLYHV